MKKDLYLVRHGQTMFNLKQIVQGWCDSPLTPLGVEQARRAGEFLRLRGIAPEAAFTSTLTRTEETIHALWPGLAYERLDGLREWFFGDFEAERNLLLPAHPWRDFFKPYGGEGQFEARERIATTIEGFMRATDAPSVLAVSHGSICREFVFHVLGEPERGYRPVPGNCAVLHFTFDTETGIFELAEQFEQEDYARELGLDPLE